VVVGCEPAHTDEGMGLSEAVAAAVDEAVRVVRDLVSEDNEDNNERRET
jgi:hydrogenase maturation protease